MAQTKVKLISDGVIVQGNLHASHGITTAHIGEGSNLYYTDARVGSYLSSNGYATQTDIVAAITDSAPATLDTLNELAAALGDDPNFATTTANSIGLKAPLASPSFTGNATFAGNVNLGDNDKLQLGAGNDLQIYHDGSNSFINDTGTGDLVILSNTVSINNASNSENIAKFLADGPVKLYYDNVQKLQTTSTGIEVSGTSSTFAGNVGIGNTSPPQKLTVNGGVFITDDITSPGSAGTYTYNGTAIDYASNGARYWSWGSGTARGTFNFIQLENDGTNQQTALSIDSSGNVGIGTTGPSNKLDVNGNIRAFSSSYVQLEVDQTDSAAVRMGVSSQSLEGFVMCNNQGAGHISGNTIIKMLVYSTGGALIESARFTTDGVGIGTTSPSAKLEVRGTAPTYTNSSTVFWGGTTNNDSHNGIMLSSFGDALGGSLASNLLYSNSNTPTQTNTNRSSGQIKFGNTTVASKTSDINFGGYYKGTTTFVERMRINGDGNVGIGTSSPATVLHIDQPSNDRAGGLYIERNGSSYGLSAFVNSGGYGVIGSNGSFTTDILTMNLNNGHVGIGTTSPDSKLHIYTDTKDSTVFKIRNYLATANGSTYQNYSELKFISDANGNAPAGIRHYANLWHNVDSALAFFTNQHGGSYAEKMRIDGDGYLRMASGTGGIQFNGDTSTANALDDYEEGSWTPQIYYQNATDQSNATNVVQQGKYTKIGNFVFVQFRLDFSQSSSSPVNDNIGVKNLPFAGANNHYAAGGNVITSDASSNGYNFALPNAGSTIAVLNNSGNIGNYGDQFGSGSNKYIRGSFAYLAQ